MIFCSKIKAMTIVVGFEKMSIHAPIGLYPEEKILGNHFIVDLRVAADIPEGMIIETIEQTIDYSHLALMTQEVFRSGRDLIETTAQQLIGKIHAAFPGIKGICLNISKQRPVTLPMVENTVIHIKTGYFE